MRGAVQVLVIKADQNASKKLVLHRETVKALSSAELSKVLGGKLSSWESCMCSSSKFENDTCPLGTSAY